MKLRERADGILKDETMINAFQLPRNQDRNNEGSVIESNSVVLTRKEAANLNFNNWRHSQLDGWALLSFEAEEQIEKTAKKVRNRGNL